MIRDYMLALLSVPLASESAPAGFAVGEPWADLLAHWLTRARELDRSLDFDLSRHPAGLSLRTRHPLAATVTLAVMTEPDVVPEVDGLLVLVACCPQWTAECDGLLVEPRWAAALLLDDAAPLFWGVSAAERQPSVLDAR